MKNSRDKTRKLPAVFEQMEPRLLFSAGTEGALAADALPGPGMPESVLVQELVSETTPANEIQAPADVRQELVFVDLSAPDYQQLADDLLANNNGNRQIKVFYLDSNQDGIEQITAVLDQQQGIDAIHIISHGNEEGLQLGNSWLTNTSLNEYRQSIQGWRNALNSEADLLLYGCNLAGGEDGAALVDKLASLTGADIAASDDLTGSAKLGGDWELEYQSGRIETSVAITDAAQQRYEAVLVNVTLESNEPGSNITQNELKTDQDWGQTFVYDSTAATYPVDRLEVMLSRDSGSTADNQTITVSLRDSFDDTPVLGSATISSNDLDGTDTWYSFDIGRVNLNDNTPYTIQVETSGGEKIFVGSDDNDGYGNGDLLNKDGNAESGKDLYFRVIQFNLAPSITSDGGGPTASINVAENTIDVTTVTATDPEGDTLTYSIGGADAAKFNINSTTGVLTFVTPPDYETPTDADADNVYEVTVIADDGMGNPTDTQSISVSVTDVSSGNPTGLLFTTTTDIATSGIPELGSWGEDSIVKIGGSNLTFDPDGVPANTTDGTFALIANLDSYFDDGAVNVRAVHYVSADITVGNTTTIDLLKGDILLSNSDNETMGGGSVAIDAEDVYVFRPNSLDNYSTGTIFLLLKNPTGGDITGISLVEHDTFVGDVTLLAGTFLLADGDVTNAEDIFLFTPDEVGAVTTGPVSIFIDGSNINIGPGGREIEAIELVEETLTIGETTLQSGTILLALNIDDNSVGDNSIAVERQDVFALDVTATGSGTTVADATLFLDGSDAGLDAPGEGLRSISLTQLNVRPTIDLPGGAINYLENDAATVIDAAATASDPDSGNLDTGTLTVDFTAAGTVNDRLAIRNEGTGSGQIGVSGSNVTYEGTTIGTFTGGTDGSTPLVITFNASSDIIAVQALMRNITYQNVSENPNESTRTIRFVLTDGDGGTSDAVTKSINVSAVNDAPVLSGANDLTAINEDPVSNPGTLVSDLISGQATDDAGMLGIAVISIDDTNGTWEYTTDGGGNWFAFGAVDITTARLLAADANTYTRFVPDANWYGTVNNGITFHAWDQTSGSAGGTADLTTNFVRDEFSSILYTNNDGTANWAGAWTESNDDGVPGSGDVRINGGELRLGNTDNGSLENVQRAVDLSTATSATLTFDYNTLGSIETNDSVLLEISSDGGSSWTTLEDFTGVSGATSGSRSFDVSAYASADTQIRFSIGNEYLGTDEHFAVDNLQIAYTVDLGGSSAYSAASASSSITVNPVNDQPTVSNVTIAATEDGATVNGSFVVNDVDTTDTHTFNITSAPSEGSVANNGDGTFTFDPGTDFQDLAFGETRDVTFTYTATDSSGAGNATSTAATVTVTVSGSNDTPVVSNVAAVSAEDGATVNGNFVVSDLDTTDTHTFAITSAPGEGSVVNNGNGTFTFDPGTDFQDLAVGETRDVSFTYTATDDSGTGNATSTAATVTVTVSGSNDVPVITIVDVTGDITEGGTVSDSGSITFTDLDLTDRPTATEVTQSVTTTLTLTPAQQAAIEAAFSISAAVGNTNNGTINWDYTIADADLDFLANGETVSAVFRITVADGNGGSDTQDVTINITGSNDTPVVSNVAAVATEDGATVNGNFVVSDLDSTDTHTFAITSAPSEGSVVNNGNGTFTFDPGADFQDLALGETRDVTFTYTATDDSGTGTATSTAATVTVTVTGTNDAAVIGGNNIGAVTEDAATPNLTDSGSLTITDADTDPSDEAFFNPASVTPAAGVLGSLTIDANGNWNYSVANADVQYLADGATKSEVFTVASLDGTTHDITVTITGINDQPVLSGANDLTAIDEEPASNPGTLVSDLLSGQVADPDSPNGMAVIGVDDTNGTWEYTTDGGSNWFAFGAVNTSTARLLAADASTSVRFVPDANWNGTVNNGITFHAWDQTSGTAGGTVDLTTNLTVRDNFSTVSYTNNDGTANWAGPWTETNDNGAAGSGGVQIIGGALSLENRDDGSFEKAQRAVDLSTATSATLSFDWAALGILELNDSAIVEISSNGGTSWTTLETFTNNSNPTSGSSSHDVSAFATANTVIRVAINNEFRGSTELFTVDNLEIAYTGVAPGGSEAFSTASASSSITVNPVNDAPVIGGDNAGAVTEDAAAPNLTDSGSLTITDVDTGEAFFNPASVTPAAGTLGSLTIDANGNWNYTVANADVQYLAAGATKVETFTIASIDGTTHDINVTITGTNDSAVIGGDDIGAVTEDTTTPNLTDSGSLTIGDTDTTPGGEAFFNPASVTPAAGTLGSLTIDANGNWNYTVANADVQYLAAGATRVETFTIASVDGTTHDINVTITGTNDSAVIGGDDIGAVTEDASTPNLTDSGSLTIGDTDTTPSDEAFFNPASVTPAAGTLGSLTIAANGDWDYTVANADVQYLATGATKVETFTIASVDGTTHDINVTITGTNDAAVIGGDDIGAVTEDATTPNLTDSGSLTITDVDTDPSDEAFFNPASVTPAAGTLGSLTIDANGNWDYTVANADVQYLATGATRVETFTIASVDGTTHDINVTITGTNDSAVIGGDDIGAVTEDASTPNLTDSGSLTIGDTDTTPGGEAFFNPASVTPAAGTLGSLTIDANGNWNYTVANADVQYLATGATKVETFIIASVDGTTHDINVTITGTNDSAVIGGDDIGAVTEDASTPNLTDSGSLTVTDVDTDPSDEAFFNPASVTPAAGTLGSLTIDANGNWDYTVANADVQYLAAGATRVETFTIASVDGTTHDINVTITGTNDRPVLSGANDLTTIFENPVSNPGTLVSDLISSQVTDADSTALTGIAVIAVDDTNGTWEYTTDGGSNWIAFGAVDASTAVLLAADANTYVRFVPDTDWNGTVNNGITFHAWDQTSGSAGGTADLTTSHTVLDQFNAASYAGNDGTVNWTNDWQELGESDGPTTGRVEADGSPSALEIGAGEEIITGRGVSREVDLAVATSATLSFDYWKSNYDEVEQSGAGVHLDISADGGASWTTLYDYVMNDSLPGSSTPASFDISAYISGNTQIRFIGSGEVDGFFNADNIQIEYSYINTNDAFSTDSSSSSITVNPVNNQPTVSNVAAAATEDGATVNGNFVVSDVDTADTHTFNITSSPSEGSVVNNGDGTFTFDPGADFQDLALGETRDVTFTYTATDDSGAGNATSAPATVTVTVTGTNDTPTVSNVAVAATEDGATVTGSFVVSDVDTQNTADTHTFTITGTPSEGSVVNNGDGSFTFDPGADFQNLALGETRDVTFTYTATDNNGATSGSATVTVTVTGTNDQPTVSNVAVAATEDGATVTGSFVVSDVDTQNTTDTHTFAITGTPSEGSVVNNGDGTFTFDPGADFQNLALGETRDVTFTYTATDDSGAGNATSTPATVTVTVTGTNDTPTVSNVAVAATEDGATITGNFVVSDVDTQNTADTHTFAITGTPSEGSVVNNGDGTFTFDPGADFQNLALGETRDVTFTYTATDNNGATSTPATVTVTVTGTNDQPTVSNVAVAATEDGATVTGSFVVSDVDTQNTADTHTFTITGTPSEGSVVNNGDGSFTFDPGADFQNLALGETRDVTFTYTATDNNGATSTPATVTVTVTGTNDQPTVSNVAVAATEDGATVTGSFVVSDVDTQNTADTHTFTITGTPSEGSVVNNGDGSFTFDPGADFQNLALGETRDVTFTYTATDNNGATSGSATVTVTVTGTNDQPTVSNVAVAATEDGATVTGNFVVSDVDTQNTADTHTFAITGTPSEGSVVNNGDGSFTFDPGADFQNLALGETRDVTFTYTATDNNGATSGSATVTVTVTGTNDTPTVSNVAVAATEDGATVTGSFVVSDVDTTDTHTFNITSSPSEGSVVNNGDGTFTFDPGADFQDLALGETRDVTFTYTATDNNGATSGSATVTVTVTGTNDQPTVSNVAVAATEDGATVTGSFVVSDVDTQNTADTHTFTITGTPSEGSVVNNGDGSFTFDPGADFQNLALGETRDVTFTYTATDNNGATSGSATVTVTVTGTNDQPTVSNVAVAATEDGATVTGSFVVSDVDTQNTTDTHTFAITGTPSEGSVVNNGDGTFTFDPGADFQNLALGETRDVTFTYTATDDSGAGNATSTPATVTVTVTGTNDQPTVSNVAVAATEDGATVTGSFVVSDVDTQNTADTHTFTITGTPSEGSVVNNGDGSFTFDPGADFQNLALGETRDVTFTYTATDNNGATSGSATVTVTVTGTNDQPTVSNVAVAATEDGATVTGSFVVSDVDTQNTADTHTFTITGTPSEGSVVNNGDGTFTFDPGADFQNLALGETRDVTFTYTATDDSGAGNATSTPATVTVTVTGTNDQPTVSNVAVAATEDGATVTGSFVVSDVDTQNTADTHTFTITGTPSEGSVVNNGDGTFSFDPGADFQDLALGETRDVTFTYTATDDSGAGNATSTPATVTVTVTGTNDTPTVSNVAVAATEDGATVTGSFVVSDVDTTDTHTFNITSSPSEGSVVNNGDGTFTFDPGTDFQDLALGETRDVTFTYTTTDDSGAGNATSTPATVTVTVTGTNDTPTVSNVAVAATEDGATVTGSFVVSDVDTTDTHTFNITSSPSEGSVVNNGDGTFTFDPGTDFQDLALGETRDVTFTYTATDDSGAGNATSTPATVTVTVTGTNDTPTVSNVAVAATEDGATVNGSFVVSDVDTTDTHTFNITSSPSEGSVVNNGDGTFSFDPGVDFQDLALGETRDVTFTYTTTDDSGAGNATSTPATVTVTVTGTNDEPTVNNVAIAATEDGATVTGSFVVSDVDTTDTHTFNITSSPSEGSVVNNGDGTFSFDPGADFQDLALGETRDVTFTYTATDDSGAGNATSTPATVTVTITGTNDTPTVSNVAIVATEDGATVTGNFVVSDADTTDTHTFNITSAPSEGSVVNNGDGTFTFDPGTDFQDLALGETRDVTFTYTATDDSSAGNATSTPATVTVTITGTNDTPTVSNVAIVATEDGATVTGNFVVSDADTTDTHTFTITGAPSEGSVVNNGDGTFTFDPGADFQDLALGETRDVTFTYTATDDSGAGNATSTPATVTVTITGTNDTPTVSNVAIVATEDGATVTGNFVVSDADTTDTHTFNITSSPSEGSVVNNSDGTFTFDPGTDFQDLALGETRDVTFTYTATDDSGAGNATSTFATVTVTVTGTNDTPTVSNVAVAATEDGATVTGSFVVSDADTTDTHTFNIMSSPSEGSVVNNGDGTFTFDPGADFQDLALGETRDVTFTYTATDDSGAGNATSGSATVTVTVTGTNDTPTVSNVAVAATEDGATITGNFVVSDADTTDTHTFSITSSPSEGSVVNNGNGTFTFDPGADFQNLALGETRDVTFTYTATDNNGATSSSAIVTVTVTGTNDQPTVSNVAVAATEDGATVTGSFVVSDIDTQNTADTHTFTITGTPSEGSVVNNGDGTFTFDPGADFQNLALGETRDVTFTYTATDDSSAGNATSTPAIVTVTVTGTNDTPTVSNVAVAATEDGATITGSFVVSDADTTDTHTFSITSSPSEGSVVNNGDGTFTFDPGTDFQDLVQGQTRDVSFTYTTIDDSGAPNANSTSATVTITVSGVNEAVTDQPPTEPTPVEPVNQPPVESDPIDLDPPAEIKKTEIRSTTNNINLNNAHNNLNPVRIDIAQPDSNKDDQRHDIQERERVASLKYDFQENLELWEMIDIMKQQISETDRGSDNYMQLLARSASGMALSLSAGVITWALRGGSILASMMSSVPLWRAFDPLPVFGVAKRKKGEDDSTDTLATHPDEDKAARILDTKSSGENNDHD